MRLAPLTLGLLALTRTAAAADPLPEGDQGIAAGYPGDAGIADDPEVVFADDFESYADPSGLSSRWDAAVFHTEQIRIATEPENIFGGGRALEFTVPQQEEELSNTVDRFVSPERDSMFLRYYSKYQGPYDVVGSSHNGSMISAHYYDGNNATPGVPADGTNKWLAGLESYRGEAQMASPGLLNVYIYHPEQRSQWGDHFYADGTISPWDPDPPPDPFGPEFVPHDNITPALDEWHCYEFMVVANTPGARDGRIAFWYDGVLAADFQNLRLRDVPELTIDRFGIGFHVYSNPGAPQRKWYDNVVAAGSYIGPVFEGGGEDDTGADAGGSDGGDTGGGDSATSAASTDGSGGGGDEAATGFEPTDDTTSTADAGSDPSGSGANAETDDDARGCACATDRRGSSDALAWMIVVLPLLARRRP